MGAAREAGRPGADDAGNIRHYADDTRSMCQLTLDPRQRHTRGNRNYQFGFADFFGDLFGHRVDDLRLDREDNDVGEITQLAVVRRHFYGELLGDRLPQRIANIAGHDVLLICQPGTNHSASNCRTDLSCTDDANFFFQHWKPPCRNQVHASIKGTVMNFKGCKNEKASAGWRRLSRFYSRLGRFSPDQLQSN